VVIIAGGKGRPVHGGLCENNGWRMVADGIYYALALTAGGGLVSYLSRPVYGAPLYLAAAFCLYFFRDPERAVPTGPVAVSPADGKIIGVDKDGHGLARICIFMNVFDVHVNRSPISGKITEVSYQRGRFLVASRAEAAAQNEQNSVTLEGGGTRVIFKQIAGLVARRIVFNKKPGDAVQAGERVGLIKFGSRVDVFLGPEWEIQVREGERVKAGSSVLARLCEQATARRRDGTAESAKTSDRPELT
jgi:phosphatidylserine decarboxylase